MQHLATVPSMKLLHPVANCCMFAKCGQDISLNQQDWSFVMYHGTTISMEMYDILQRQNNGFLTNCADAGELFGFKYCWRSSDLYLEGCRASLYSIQIISPAWGLRYHSAEVFQGSFSINYWGNNSFCILNWEPDLRGWQCCFCRKLTPNVQEKIEMIQSIGLSPPEFVRVHLSAYFRNTPDPTPWICHWPSYRPCIFNVFYSCSINKYQWKDLSSTLFPHKPISYVWVGDERVKHSFPNAPTQPHAIKL